jgi:hypothetical protein
MRIAFTPTSSPASSAAFNVGNTHKKADIAVGFFVGHADQSIDTRGNRFTIASSDSLVRLKLNHRLNHLPEAWSPVSQDFSLRISRDVQAFLCPLQREAPRA